MSLSLATHPHQVSNVEQRLNQSQAEASLLPVPPAESQCGLFLDACTCRRRPITPRTVAEIRARHEASVARARRSGWGAWITKPPRLVSDPTGRRWAA